VRGALMLAARIALVAVLAGLGGVAVTQRRGGIDTRSAADARTALAELRAREETLLNDKDHLLGNQLRNVDPLAEDVAGLRACVQRLAPLGAAAWLDPAARALVKKSLDECQAALKAQETNIETLKSYAAVGRNSSDNFPAYAEALVKKAPRALLPEVQKLQLLVAEFLGGRENHAAEIHAIAAKLKAAKAPTPELAEELQWLAGHAEVIVEARKTVRQHQAALAEPQARQAIALLDATFQRGFDAAVARELRGRVLLVGLGGAAAALAIACVLLRKRTPA
jgi:DAHL domain